MLSLSGPFIETHINLIQSFFYFFRKLCVFIGKNIDFLLLLLSIVSELFQSGNPSCCITVKTNFSRKKFSFCLINFSSLIEWWLPFDARIENFVSFFPLVDSLFFSCYENNICPLREIWKIRKSKRKKIISILLIILLFCFSLLSFLLCQDFV